MALKSSDESQKHSTSHSGGTLIVGGLLFQTRKAVYLNDGIVRAYEINGFISR
jgi:hypothetical protein